MHAKKKKTDAGAPPSPPAPHQHHQRTAGQADGRHGGRGGAAHGAARRRRAASRGVWRNKNRAAPAGICRGRRGSTFFVTARKNKTKQARARGPQTALLCVAMAGDRPGTPGNCGRVRRGWSGGVAGRRERERECCGRPVSASCLFAHARKQAGARTHTPLWVGAGGHAACLLVTGNTHKKRVRCRAGGRTRHTLPFLFFFLFCPRGERASERDARESTPKK